MNRFKENLLFIGFILVASTITTVYITGQYAYATKGHILHNQIHQQLRFSDDGVPIPLDNVKMSKHL